LKKLLLVNKTEKAIRHLRIDSNNDKVLGFDLPPSSEIRLTASPPKGDSSAMRITGQFDDGRVFENSTVIDVTNMSQPLIYNIVIVVTEEGIDIRRGVE